MIAYRIYNFLLVPLTLFAMYLVLNVNAYISLTLTGIFLLVVALIAVMFNGLLHLACSSFNRLKREASLKACKRYGKFYFVMSLLFWIVALSERFGYL